jgi:hypothetical protein
MRDRILPFAFRVLTVIGQIQRELPSSKRMSLSLSARGFFGTARHRTRSISRASQNGNIGTAIIANRLE